ncbi:coenzyme Q-binding protein COQ10 homolog B, mitochondrial [Diaphorina citri]|uniref:Coenzyme Q-binding protein COQ10 homolog B, mitochondrial n=1 Tax=Diaphorina citri TaxID=121845 RepID=A0A1S3D043_DIACI|nr:coenzyme Q-binding protein COQ10 homolog B, mitochondrial [Diaphorina citri]
MSFAPVKTTSSTLLKKCIPSYNAIPLIYTQQKSFFNIADTFSKKKEYLGRKLVGYSREQMYEVVSDVENYKNFVPFCKKSVVTYKSEKKIIGSLTIGFPPIVESYTSNVTLDRPKLIKANCFDGKLFDHLVTMWRFHRGLEDVPQSCVIDFYVSFEFKSLLHSNLAHMFFNELVRQMEKAFFAEAEMRYGNRVLLTSM